MNEWLLFVNDSTLRFLSYYSTTKPIQLDTMLLRGPPHEPDVACYNVALAAIAARGSAEAEAEAEAEAADLTADLSSGFSPSDFSADDLGEYGSDGGGGGGDKDDDAAADGEYDEYREFEGGGGSHGMESLQWCLLPFCF